MAKDTDANLAEIDMENFRTEGIHSLLTAIQSRLKSDAERKTRNNSRIFSAVTGATAAGLIAADMMDSSICKSEFLFSPVKEHIKVDSLDMEKEIVLTCQANKDNNTITFEQSVLYSDGSYYDRRTTERKSEEFVIQSAKFAPHASNNRTPCRDQWLAIPHGAN